MKTINKSSRWRRYVSILLAAAMVFCIGMFSVSAEGDPVIDTTILAEGSNGNYAGDKDVAFEIVDNTLKLNVKYYFETQDAFSSDEPAALEAVNGFCSINAYGFFGFSSDFYARQKVYLNGEQLEQQAMAQDSPCWYSQSIKIVRSGAPAGYYKMYKTYELVINPGMQITEDFFDNNQLVFEGEDTDGNVTGTLTVGTYKEPTPIHTHTEETIAGTPATCTEPGLTDGVKCSECEEILTAQEEIPALGHDYVDGICTRCGAEDPDYVKPEMTATLTSERGTELKAKKQTTLTAEVKNGTGDYEYKFIVYNKTTNQWYKLRDFAPENTFDWYTGPGGEKNLYVDVKDKTTGEVKRFQLDVNVAESDLAVTSFTSSAGTELVTKAHTTLTAVAEKGTAPYEYKFIVYNETTQQWYKLKDFGSESTFDWYTGPEGSKKLYVDVKDADGTVVRKELAVNVSEAASAQLDNAA